MANSTLRIAHAGEALCFIRQSAMPNGHRRALNAARVLTANAACGGCRLAIAQAEVQA